MLFTKISHENKCLKFIFEKHHLKNLLYLADFSIKTACI